MTQPELFRQAVLTVTELGFAFHEKCNCVGNLQHHYKSNDLNLYIKIYVHKSHYELRRTDKKGQLLVRGDYSKIKQAIDENS